MLKCIKTALNRVGLEEEKDDVALNPARPRLDRPGTATIVQKGGDTRGMKEAG